MIPGRHDVAIDWSAPDREGLRLLLQSRLQRALRHLCAIALVELHDGIAFEDAGGEGLGLPAHGRHHLQHAADAHLQAVVAEAASGHREAEHHVGVLGAVRHFIPLHLEDQRPLLERRQELFTALPDRAPPVDFDDVVAFYQPAAVRFARRLDIAGGRHFLLPFHLELEALNLLVKIELEPEDGGLLPTAGGLGLGGAPPPTGRRAFGPILFNRTALCTRLDELGLEAVPLDDLAVRAHTLAAGLGERRVQLVVLLVGQVARTKLFRRWIEPADSPPTVTRLHRTTRCHRALRCRAAHFRRERILRRRAGWLLPGIGQDTLLQLRKSRDLPPWAARVRRHHLMHLAVRIAVGHVDSVDALHILDGGVGAGVQEHPDGFRPLELHRQVQRRASLVVLQIDLGLGSNKPADHAIEAHGRGEVQGRAVRAVADIDSPRDPRVPQHELNSILGTLKAGDLQDVLAVIVPDLVPLEATLLEEGAQERRLVLGRGLQQLELVEFHVGLERSLSPRGPCQVTSAHLANTHTHARRARDGGGVREL
mmetsp:Transcript_174569/g.559679  ORF Transcript_174569/g.559679 Transcript_174569/m.559679 type:complete len:538 (-) Transcript_174569:40-1653(-)